MFGTNSRGGTICVVLTRWLHAMSQLTVLGHHNWHSVGASWTVSITSVICRILLSMQHVARVQRRPGQCLHFNDPKVSRIWSTCRVAAGISELDHCSCRGSTTRLWRW